MRENSDRHKQRDFIQNNCTFQKCQSWKKKKNCRRLKKPQGTWQLNTLCDSELDSGPEKEY